MRPSHVLLGMGILVVPIAGGFTACSSSSSTGGASGGGGMAGTISIGGSSGADSSVGGTGNSSTGGNGTGGVADNDAIALQDTSWFDGNWENFWGECEGGVDPGPPPGGTPNCPLDMNKEGCPCSPVGKTAPCFTGDRKNRNRGACHDGTTTCTKFGEMAMAWGDCVGEVLPTPGVTSGKEACTCFTEGRWRIENLEPCLWAGPGNWKGAMSTIPSGDPNNPYKCPSAKDGTQYIENNTPPPQNWSPNWLKVDCAGVFKLCIKLRAGDPLNPSESDCLLADICVNGSYSTPGEEQKMPDLGPWVTKDAACAERWWNVGAYGQMNVTGMSVECDPIPGHMFTQVTYCPAKCALEENKGLPECNCKNNLAGDFTAKD